MISQDFEQSLTSMMRGLVDQDIGKALERQRQQIGEYREQMRAMVEGEVAIRECLETTASELEICKQHFKQKVIECDNLEAQLNEADRLKLDQESQIYQLSKVNETLKEDLQRLKSK